MREQINQALKQAMKDKNKLRTGTLRLVNAAITDRDIAARGKGEPGVSDDEILEILSRMIKQRRDSIIAFNDGGRPELAVQDQEEIEIVTEFLPQQLDEDEIRDICASVIEEIGAQGLKDMGRTMGELKKRHTGQMDFSKASRFVKEALG